MKVNKANFLIWNNATTGVELPIYSASCPMGELLWLVGDTMSFMINENMPSGISLTLHKLDLARTQSHSFGAASSFVSEVTEDRLYSGTLTCPSITEGYYSLKATSGATIYWSNPIRVISSADHTAKFKFRHKFLKNKVDYTENTSFYQEFRLWCNFNNMEYEISKDIIKDADFGSPREYNHRVDYAFKINLLNLSLDMHQAAHDMVTCSELLINGDKFQVDGGYSSNPIRRDGLSNGSFKAYQFDLRHVKRY